MLNDKSSIEELYNLKEFPGLPLETDLSSIRQIQQQKQPVKINQQAVFNKKLSATPKFISTPVINKSPKIQATIPVFKKSKPVVGEVFGNKDPETGIISIKNTNLLPTFPNFNNPPETIERKGKVEFPTTKTGRPIISPKIKLNQQIEDKNKLGGKTLRMEQELMDEVERRRQIHLKIDVTKLIDVRVGKKHLSYDKSELIEFLKELHKSSAGNKDVLIERIIADRKEVGL